MQIYRKFTCACCLIYIGQHGVGYEPEFEVSKLGNITLNAVPCPKCDGQVKGIIVEENSIVEAKRVPVLVTARCNNNHSVVLFVDRNFTIRDVEAAGEVVQEPDVEGMIDKTQKWMDSF